MKNKLLFNLLTPFATSNTEGKTFRNLLALVMVVIGMNGVMGQIAAFNNTWTGSPATVNATTTDANVGTITMSRGAGITSTSSTSGFRSVNFASGATLTIGNNDYITFTITANPSYSINLNSAVLSISLGSSGTGPQTFGVYSSVLGFASTSAQIGANLTASNSQTITFPSSGYNGLSSVEIRIYGWNASAGTGTGGPSSISLTGSVSSVAPEINIKQSTTSYITGSTYAFGNQIATTSSSATTFTIENTGNATLNLSGSPKVAISGNTSEFTVDQTSTASTVAASATTSFTVTFNPTSTGAKSAAISIANDDATGSENPYVINLTGTGTVNSSSASDIITQSGYSYTSNIDYASKQTASSLTIANSVGVNGLTLRDGGATTDADALGTTLTEITFSTGGSTAIRTAALFDGTNKIAEVAVNGSTSIAFTGLSLSATDGGTKDFELRVTYQSSVTDNQQIIYTISAATASATNSGFALANAGAASSSNTSDINRLEVTADRLTFVQQTSNVAPNSAMSPAPTVSANDALANRDLDFTSSVRITSTGTLTGTPVDVTASSGLATFNSLTHTVLGSSLTLNAERTSGLDWDVTSNTFNITVQAPGLLLLEDNFDAASGTNLTALGYSDHSSGASPIKINASGLSYTNFGSSNIGNAAVINASGEDVNRTFTSQSSGSTTYCAFLVNISSATSSGDYILHLGPSVIATEFRCRLYTKFVSGILNFGVSTNGNTVNYASNSCSYGTTYLVVLKHFFNGTTQTSSIYINPSLLNEPGAPDATETSSTSLSTNIGSVAIRQSSTNNVAIIDGIRVATNWGALMGNPQYSDNTTIAAGNYNSITTYDGSTPSISGNVNVYNQLSILGGTLTTNNTLTLKSNANGTAQVAAIGSGGSITGNVTVERYIPSGKRAFRLLSPAVTTSNYISNNWQGQTHITGGASGGFDATETNNPSMFTYNNQVASGTGWAPIANTNATNLTAGVGYRMLVRGNRNVNLTVASQDNMNAAITLSATGTLRTGTVTLDASSTPAINNTANTTTANYSLVGNPYQSAVDWHLVTRTGIEDTYYAWAPNMGTGAARGNYVAYNVSTGNSGGGSVGQFIQPGQAFFVKNTVSGTAGTLTFQEAHKASTNANVFRTNNQTESTNFATLSMQLYDPNELAIGGYPIDATKAVFGSDYTNELGLGDATKLEAAGENIAWFRNNTKLAIDAAAPVTTSDELVMKTLRLGANKNYTFKIQTTNFDTALTPYLVDNFLNTQTEISTSQAYLATFATTSNVASYNENRFKIVFQNAVLSHTAFQNTVAIYPNPAKAGASFYVEGISEATVTVSNLLGQNIPVETKNQGNTLQVTPNTSLSQGVYLVNITTQGTTQQVKWIVE